MTMVGVIYAYLLFFLTVSYMKSGSPRSVARSNDTDQEALISFKNNLIGFGSPLMSWNRSVHFCKWAGVTCSNRQVRVTALQLSDQGLVGSLSPSIANLTFLHTLNLSENGFRGSIPRGIDFLSRLRVLDLSRNSFQGDLPVNLSQSVQVLSLSYNSFVGRIPEELGSLRELSSLLLNYNYLGGRIPPTFGNLTSLVILSLLNCSLEGSVPDIWDNIGSLKVLQLGLNHLSGIIPSSLYNLSNLEYFAVAGNQLEGSFPSTIGLSFPKLQFLYVGGNQFSGSVPVSLSNVSQLLEADFSINNFSSFVPVSFSKLQNLRLLNLQRNALGGHDRDEMSFLNSMTNLTSLQVLGLNGNGLSGILPRSISNISANLRELWLGSNNIYGNIPSEIADLQSLVGLGIEYNSLSGPIPSDIGKLSRVVKLLLNGNGLTGSIPPSIGNMTQLGVLILARNNLTGTIPSTLGNCQHLQGVSLFHNHLSGNIPGHLFSISSMSDTLDLSSNSLTGTLPAEVGNLVNLGNLLIRDNNLSGKIPSTLGQCVHLQILYLDGNSFQGEIPDSFVSLRGIDEIDLSRNKLSGKIPPFLGQLPNLKFLNLSFNELEGQVPSTNLFANVSKFLVAGNDRLCGGVQALNLTPCATHDILPIEKRRRHRTAKVIIPLVAGCLVLIFLSLVLIVTCYKRKSRENSPSTNPISVDSFMTVTYTDLLRATGGLSKENLIGLGSYGSVYKGNLACGGEGEYRNVAVKVLNLFLKGGHRSFIAECEALKNTRHRNLVKIITACSGTDYKGNDFKALVFDYMSNGSLEKWLHPNGYDQSQLRPLSFPQRLSMAIDVASAVSYLHHDCQNPIVHCDIKPSNILLDEDMNAHVGDFGLSRLLIQQVPATSSYGSNSSTLIKGSIGYVAPGKQLLFSNIAMNEILLLEYFS